MAKARSTAKQIKRKKKKTVNPETAKQTKRFFTITALVVFALLALIFIVYSM